MRRFLLALCAFVSLWFTLPGQSQVRISQEPYSALTTNGDDLLINSTNNAAGTWTTHRINLGDWVTNAYVTNHLAPTANAVLTNYTLFNPNIYNGTGTISTHVGSHLWTNSSSVTAIGIQIGDYLLPAGGGQFTVMDTNATIITTFEAAQANLSSVAWQFYTNNATFDDSTGRQMGGITGGGSVVISALNRANTGGLYLDTGTNAFEMYSRTYGGKQVIAFDYEGVFPFQIYSPSGNTYAALEIIPNGMVSFPYGVTNFFAAGAAIPWTVPMNMASNILSGGIYSATATNLITPAGTISGTVNQFQLTSSASDFSAVQEGWQIVVTNNTYTVDFKNSATIVQTVEPLGFTYAGATFTLLPPTFQSNNRTPQPSSAIAADGSFVANGANNTSNGRFIYANLGHGGYTTMTGVGGGNFAWGLFTQKSGGFPFSLDERAPNGSIQGNADGTISFSSPLTNDSGNTTLGGVVQLNQGLRWSQLQTNSTSGTWIDFQPGQIININAALGSPGVANTVYFCRVLVPFNTTVSQVDAYIGTGVAASHMGFSLYTVDGNTRVVDSGAVSTASSSTAIAANITAVAVPAGWYLLAWNGTSTSITYEETASAAASVLPLNQGLWNYCGTAANAAAAGQNPATLGALTAANVLVPIGAFKQ